MTVTEVLSWADYLATAYSTLNVVNSARSSRHGGQDVDDLVLSYDFIHNCFVEADAITVNELVWWQPPEVWSQR